MNMLTKPNAQTPGGRPRYLIGWGFVIMEASSIGHRLHDK
jgi:hypothetical protein